MLRYISIPLVAMLLVELAVAPATARTWTSATGAVQIEAELIEKRADGTVVLKRADGVTIETKPEKFSAADQEFIRQWKPPAAAKPLDGSTPKTDGSEAGTLLEPEEKEALDKIKTAGAKAAIQAYEQREKELRDSYVAKQ